MHELNTRYIHSLCEISSSPSIPLHPQARAGYWWLVPGETPLCLLNWSLPFLKWTLCIEKYVVVILVILVVRPVGSGIVPVSNPPLPAPHTTLQRPSRLWFTIHLGCMFCAKQLRFLLLPFLWDALLVLALEVFYWFQRRAVKVSVLAQYMADFDIVGVIQIWTANYEVV